jgi:hypothetical protein
MPELSSRDHLSSGGVFSLCNCGTHKGKSFLVFESPVQFSFLAPLEATVNQTGSCLLEFIRNRRLDRYEPVCRGCFTVPEPVATGSVLDWSKPVWNWSGQTKIVHYLIQFRN